MKLYPVLFAALSLGSALTSYAYDVEDELKRLDDVLLHAGEYVSTKEARLQSYEEMLNSGVTTPDQMYHLLDMLYEEYQPYSFDKALGVLDRMEALSLRIKSEERRVDVLLNRAMLLSSAGFFLDAQNTIGTQLDTNRMTVEQKYRFYDINQKFAGDYREYLGNSSSRDNLTRQQSLYKAMIFNGLPSDDKLFLRTLLSTLFDEGNYEEAEKVALSLIDDVKTGDKDYALYAYYMAIIKLSTGSVDEMVHWFVESAICDIRNAVKDNASLFYLAKEILSMGEVERSFRYTQQALDDALFYNARLRPFQIASALPAIQSAYDVQRNQEASRRTALIILISVMFFFIVVSLSAFFITRDKSSKTDLELAAVAHDLEDAIERLREANAVKEEYIGLFLLNCSSYLDKLRKHISVKEMEEELKVFYNSFDNAFLHLYPNFVSDFNSLLREDARVELKKDELLNTELRIFALIRLGITQSSHIASLLRYSVNTIYNYRAQVKKAALCESEKFEDLIRNL